jgi:hypothetical protein
MKLESVTQAVTACIILHNIITEQKVKERVMAKFNLTHLDDDYDDIVADQPLVEPYNGPEDNGQTFRNHMARELMKN